MGHLCTTTGKTIGITKTWTMFTQFLLYRKLTNHRQHAKHLCLRTEPSGYTKDIQNKLF